MSVNKASLTARSFAATLSGTRLNASRLLSRLSITRSLLQRDYAIRRHTSVLYYATTQTAENNLIAAIATSSR